MRKLKPLQRRLEKGDRFVFIDDKKRRPHVVVRTSPSSAVVRQELANHTVIPEKADDGSVVGVKAEFDVPGRPYTISLYSFVEFL